MQRHSLKLLLPIGLALLTSCGSNTTEPATSTTVSESTSISESTSSTLERTQTTTTSQAHAINSTESTISSDLPDPSEENYQVVLKEFKEKLVGEWTYSNSTNDGIDLYKEISEITFNSDGSFSKKMTSTKDDTISVLFENQGTYEISENGFKQTLEGLSRQVTSYDEFASQDAAFMANFIKIKFSFNDTTTTTGVYIYPNGALTFENPELLFNDKVTGLAQFTKF